MDNENRIDQPQEENWLDDILSPPELGDELGVDEHAVSSAGLMHPADVELEQIIRETKLEQWVEELEAETLSQQEPQNVPAPFQEAIPEETVTDDTRAVPPTAEEPGDPFQDEDFRMTFGDGDILNQLFADEAQESSDPELADESDVPMFFDAEQEETDAETEIEDEEADTEPGEDEASEKKGRPSRKKGYGLLGIPHILATVVWLAIAVTIGISLGRLIWVCASDVLAFGRESQKITITISEADDMDTIAGKLKDAGLIKYPQLFLLYADITDAQEEIDPGTYELDTIYDYNALVNFMSTSTSNRDVVSVMIPEGYTCAQIFALLEEKQVCTAAELEEYAANGDLGDYWFLEGIQRGDKYCLEGYLFPDTYDFYVGDQPGRVLSKLLGDGVGGFEVRFTEVMQEKLDALNQRLAAMMKKNGYDQSYIDQNLVTVREVVIVASMIEKETSGSKESYTIASVIYNRLTNQREFPYLNIDATLIYALGGKTDPLTEADKQVDSPYNTYTHKGLIPGPISNPGTSSLNAALDPDETDYYYYVYDPSIYAHHFSKTYEEHLKYIASMED